MPYLAPGAPLCDSWLTRPHGTMWGLRKVCWSDPMVPGIIQTNLVVLREPPGLYLVMLKAPCDIRDEPESAICKTCTLTSVLSLQPLIKSIKNIQISMGCIAYMSNNSRRNSLTLSLAIFIWLKSQWEWFYSKQLCKAKCSGLWKTKEGLEKKLWREKDLLGHSRGEKGKCGHVPVNLVWLFGH